jgi:hypothetical protein
MLAGAVDLDSASILMFERKLRNCCTLVRTLVTRKSIFVSVLDLHRNLAESSTLLFVLCCDESSSSRNTTSYWIDQRVQHPRGFSRLMFKMLIS